MPDLSRENFRNYQLLKIMYQTSLQTIYVHTYRYTCKHVHGLDLQNQPRTLFVQIIPSH